MAPIRTAILACAIVLASLFPAFGQAVTVGVAWANLKTERWKRDEAGIREALTEAGLGYLSADAKGDAKQQAEDIRQLVAKGAGCILVVAIDAEAVAREVDQISKQGICFIAYDRFLGTSNAFYVSFDNLNIGRQQARAVFAERPTGRYAFIKGSDTDPNSGFLFSGQLEVLADAMAAGDIVNVGEASIADWSKLGALRAMKSILAQHHNQVDAVVASNDQTAEGAIEALAEVGLAGKVPVSGQDAEVEALNRIARGTQTVTVWKDTRALGHRAGAIAALLIRGIPPQNVPGAIRFVGDPSAGEVNAFLMPAAPITQDNLSVVIDAGWATRDVICAGVPSGSLKLCD